jgi:hypothetical protein
MAIIFLGVASPLLNGEGGNTCHKEEIRLLFIEQRNG